MKRASSMSEDKPSMDTQPMQTAGAMLRAARQAQGLHIAALATMLKVSQRKLEALEADRHDELQGPTFVRALAQAACRALKIDPGPILARLPTAGQHTLDRVHAGLNTPFRERGARHDVLTLPGIGPWALTIVGLLLVAAAAMWWLPAGWRLWGFAGGARVAVTTAGLASAEASGAAGTVVAPAVQATASSASTDVTPAATPAVADASAASVPASTPAPMAVAAAHLLRVAAASESWVDVTDANGQSLLSRTLHPGEAIDLGGALPLHVKIGNAGSTTLSFKGQPLDLAPYTRDNIARLELK